MGGQSEEMTMLPGYKITRRLYVSQRTEIFRATRELDGLPVVLKVRSGLASQKRHTGLTHEYELGKTLKGHRSITYLTCERTTQKSLILVLQDDRMNALESVVPPKGFHLSQFFTIAIEIVSALEEIHSQNVIHKDMNPSNIIVNSTLDAVKLIDFELATRIGKEMVGFEPPAALQGTIAYISPEQTGRINTPIDLRSDLYSLGITIYRLISGRLPFETTNPAELIYSHIAKTPVPVHEIRPEIPQTVSLIIEKLLKKSPTERYQTAAGIKRDFLALQEAMTHGNKRIDFTPGQQEHTGRIALSEKLYGRDKETARLLDCFSRCRDAGQVVAITGAAGIGKTTLIHKLYAPITAQNGFFLSGKFDQLDKGLAYTALTDALKDFVRQCLGQDKETREVWRAAVQSSVGEFGQVLTAIVPDFQHLIGSQPAVVLVSPLETVARRNAVFSNLIKDICAVGSPLILFLDDLQWADSATASLLETIVASNPKNLMIILSYRDKELPPVHPVTRFLRNVSTGGMTFSAIHLENLNEKTVNDWLNDILPGADHAAQKLTAQVMTNTEGNPFYVTSLLHLILEKNYIKRQADGALSIDMRAITHIPADANVVEHLIRKIKSLKKRDREFLTQVSILGNRFSLETLGIFLGEKQRTFQDAIQALAEAHLLIKSGESIRFSHDRVQQAARALLDNSAARALHLQAGRNISAALEARNPADKQIEEYIHHYNAAIDLITDVSQRQELAQLNVMLGKRLKSHAAYQSAEKAFAQAIAFLPPKPFETDYHLSIDLFTEYGEVLFLNLKYEEGEKQFATVLRHSQSPLDSAKVYVKQITHHAAHHHLEQAMGIALHALEMLDVKLPKRFLKIAAIADLLRVKSLLKNKKPEDILHFPVTDDLLVLAQLDVLFAAAVPAYMAYHDYFSLVVFKAMRTVITKGNCRVSPLAYIGYALILCNLGDVDSAYSYGRAALALMEKLDAKQLVTKLSYLFAVYVHHWKAPAQDGVTFFKQAIDSGLKTGDYEYASYAVNAVMHYSFYSGESIHRLLKQFPEQHRLLAGFHKDHASIEIKYWHQLLITMNDPDGDGITVSGEIIDEDWLVPLLEERQDLTSLAVCMIGKMQLAYLAGNYVLAESARTRAIELLKALAGDMFIPICHFFAALTCIAYYRKHARNRFLLRDAKQSLKKLKKWGASAPDNYLYKAQLVEAELLSIQGKHVSAIQLYDAAIENAMNAGNNLDLGIACECMGRYLESIGLQSSALMFIRRSITVFHGWGALNKSNRLRREFHIAINRDNILPEIAVSPHSSQTINAQLDLETLADTIRALTSDFKFDSLVATLLEAVVHSSGATRVVYIHVDQDRFHVKAEKQGSSKVRIFEGENTRLASFELPTGLLEKYHSGFCEPILENIQAESLFCGEVLQESQRKSVLFIPLMRHQTVKGLVYLENDLMANAFRKDQVQFLSLLAGQAAIAIENALIFERLNAERDYSSNIIQNSSSLICGIDSRGITIFINPIIEKVTGYCKDELLGKNWWELFYPGEEYEQVDRLFIAFTGGNVVDYEMRLTCKNGETRDILWSSLTKRDSNGHIIEIIGFGNDITERKRAENVLQEYSERLEEMVAERTRKLKEAQTELVRKERLSALGQLTATVAHEIRNPLGTVRASVFAISDALERNEPHRIARARKLAERNIIRCDNIITELLDYTRDRVLALRLTHIDMWLGGVLDEQTIPAGIICVRELNAGIDVLIDCEHLRRAIINIVSNAIHALQDENSSGNQLSVNTRVAKNRLEIRVSDAGCGISANVRERIFEPLFSTRTLGVGLGMPIVKDIMEAHGGGVEIQSEEGKGTIVTLWLKIERTVVNDGLDCETSENCLRR